MADSDSFSAKWPNRWLATQQFLDKVRELTRNGKLTWTPDGSVPETAAAELTCHAKFTSGDAEVTLWLKGSNLRAWHVPHVQAAERRVLHTPVSEDLGREIRAMAVTSVGDIEAAYETLCQLAVRPAESPRRPVVVCLCGSTRFGKAYAQAQRVETLAGKIVLSVGLLGHQEGLDMQGSVKQMLDELHLRKIDLADEILVLNVGGYIGASTRREIDYATISGKRVRYLIDFPGSSPKA